MGKVDLTVSVDADLVTRAKHAGLDIDAIAARAIDDALARPDRPSGFAGSARREAPDPEGAERRAREWAEANKEAIADYNRRIAERGVFGEDLRRW